MRRPFTGKEFRAAIVAGLTVVVPLFLTIYVFNLIISAADRLIIGLPEMWGFTKYLQFPGAGLILAVLVVLLSGILVRNFIGKALVGYINSLIEHIPVIASIYKLSRQVSDAFIGQGKKGFREVVLIEWPRPGAWTVAFVTGPAPAKVAAHKDTDLLSLFVPTPPNPTSGFVVFSERASLRATALSVEEALKLVVSMGALTTNTESAQ